MKYPLVSIILPVYNVGQYIAQCLDSIIKQSYTNTEIIIVIDGATDNSMEIAKKYAIIDSRIRIIYQDNAGSGPARNNGLDHASGEFIAFIDPDDWIKQDYIETLVNIQLSGDYDMVIIGHQKCIFDRDRLVKSTKKTFSENKTFLSKQSVREHYLSLRFIEKLIDTPWGRLYKKSIIDNNSLRFPELRRSQDIYFNTLYYNHVTSIYESTYAGYYYREVLGDRSIKKTDYYKTLEILYDQLKDLYNQWGMNFDNNLVLSVFILNVIFIYEKIIYRKESIIEFETNPFVCYLIKNARPQKIIHRFELFCLKNKLHNITYIILMIKNLLKKIR